MGQESVNADILAMSDDDFLNAAPPVVEPAQEPVSPQEPVNQEPVNQEPANQEPVQKTEEELAEEQRLADEAAAAANTKPDESEGDDDKNKKPDDQEVDPSLGSPEADPTKDKKPDTQEPTEEQKQTAQAEEAKQHAEFYKQVMGEFQANGKKISLKSPDEAIKLMQMGANYTAKMQQLAPHRRVLMMLENNGLLDEGKLSYLIDIDKKNPEAIHKLIKDAGINPLDIDATAPVDYKGGNHTVSDQVVNFRSTLDEMSSTDDGKQTLEVINKWDKSSKESLLDDPSVMNVIHEQRSNGIYDRIAAEVERQRTLGNIGADVPFLRAYLHVGNALQKQNGFADLVGGQQQQVQAPAPVASRPAVRAPEVTANDKAKAAATSQAAARQVRSQVNPLAMSDDDFLKSFENRV